MAKTFCTNCGQELEAAALFCPECGQPSAKEEAAKPAAAKPILPDLRNLNLPENWWIWALGALIVLVVIAAVLTRESAEESAATNAVGLEEPDSGEATGSPARKSVPTAAQQAQQVPATGRWEAEVEVSPLDDSKTLYLDLDANQAVWGQRSRSFTPRLSVMCEGRQLRVYVLIGVPAERERRRNLVTARLRFDGLEPETTAMVRSQEDDALFFQQPVEIIRRMMRHESLVFGFTPVDSEIALTTFDLRGLTEAVRPIREQCGWEDEEDGRE